MIFRFRYKVLGGHTHVRVFAGRGEGSLGNCGSLAFRNEEWEAFKNAFAEPATISDDVEFVED